MFTHVFNGHSCTQRMEIKNVKMAEKLSPLIEDSFNRVFRRFYFNGFSNAFSHCILSQR